MWFGIDYDNSLISDYLDKINENRNMYTYSIPNDVISCQKASTKDVLKKVYNEITRVILNAIHDRNEYAEISLNKRAYDVESFVSYIRECGYKAEISCVTNTEKTIKISGWSVDA